MNIFNCLNINEYIDFNNSELITLPPIIDIFLSIYKTGETTNISPILKSGDTFCSFFVAKHIPHLKGVALQDLFNKKEILLDYKKFSCSDELLIQNNLIRIGTTSVQGGICVGLGSNNMDKIYLYDGDMNQLFELSTNIFLFLNNLDMELDLLENIDPSNLYKNWNEDFWRIKPPEFRDARPYELLDKSTLDKKYLEMKKQGIDMIEIEYEYKIRGFDGPKSFFNW